MPKVVILRRTWHCPACFAEWDSDVRNGLLCPYCKDGVVSEERDPARCGTLTVKGEEDIEAEIEERSESTFRTRRLMELEAWIAQQDRTGVFPSPIAKQLFIEHQQTEIERVINQLKTTTESLLSQPTFEPHGFFLISQDDINNYRARRKLDIAAAIRIAKQREYQP